MNGVHDLLIQRIQLGMKFKAENAVIQVDQAGRFGSLDNLSFGLHSCQRNNVFADHPFFIAFRYKIIVKHRAVFRFVKRGVPGFQHLLDFLRYLKSIFLHAFDSGCQTDGIPGFKRPHLQIEAPLHGIVDIHNGIGNFRNPVGRIDQIIGNCFPGKIGTLVLTIYHRLHFIRQGLGFMSGRQTG